MNIFKSLFKMPKVIDAAINAGDALVFTDEERKQFVIESAKVLGPQTMARRVVSVILTSIWALLTIINVGLIVLGHANQGEFADLYTQVTVLFGGLMAFYFGTGAIRAAK